MCDYQLSALCTVYLLWSRCRCLASFQGVAGVLKDLTGATSLILFPTQSADKEQLGGAFSQGGFGWFGQDVTVPLLALQYTGMVRKKMMRGNTRLLEDKTSSYLWSGLEKDVDLASNCVLENFRNHVAAEMFLHLSCLG